MFTNQVRLALAVSAVVISLLAPGVTRAASPKDFEGIWTGTYYTGSGAAVSSRLSLRLKDGSGLAGFAGDWDGFKVIEGRSVGSGLILHLEPFSPQYGAAPGVHHYVVKCTLNSNRTLSIQYDGVNANGTPVKGYHGGTAAGEGFRF